MYLNWISELDFTCSSWWTCTHTSQSPTLNKLLQMIPMSTYLTLCMVYYIIMVAAMRHYSYRAWFGGNCMLIFYAGSTSAVQAVMSVLFTTAMLVVALLCWRQLQVSVFNITNISFMISAGCHEGLYMCAEIGFGETSHVSIPLMDLVDVGEYTCLCCYCCNDIVWYI